MTNVKIPLTVTRAVRLFKVLNARNTTIDFLLAEGLNNLVTKRAQEKGNFLPAGLNNLAASAGVVSSGRGAVAAGAEAGGREVAARFEQTNNTKGTTDMKNENTENENAKAENENAKAENENTKAENENTKAENEKRGEAAAKQDPRANDAKYTRLAFLRAVCVLNDAVDCGIYNIDLAERVREEAEIEESEDNPGTWFVEFHAKTWREAAAFAAAIVGAAFARGYYADVSAGWEAGLAAKDGGRFVDVFVASADFMTDDGKPVVG